MFKPTSQLIAFTFLLFSCSLLTGCGGGSSDDSATADVDFPQLTGTWTGILRKAEARCSDGSSLPSEEREISIVVNGGDFFNDGAGLDLDGCFYSGPRNTLSEIELYSEDLNCNRSIDFFEIEGNKAKIITRTRNLAELGEVIENSNNIVCIAEESGDLTRN